MSKKILAVLLASFTAFSAAASVPPVNKWIKVQADGGVMFVNRNKVNNYLSLVCENKKHVWVSLESDQGYLITPDPDVKNKDADISQLEILVTGKDGTIVKWSVDDLGFNKPGYAGQQRIEAFINSLHEAREVDALIDDLVVERFVGAPGAAIPSYNQISDVCRNGVTNDRN